ncbi:helix-turn-helix domain-containing protein [Lentilactobacillus parakefiri]|uniref:HTH cro/C1-type domain-containing protein n=1 Tax=Lentilactobacillus parakefiri TaxID=152332 RepID=A0A269YHR3_9LACO|nr:hypothetical protein B8W98_04340 [Lentilactobacillus parakefiri]PAL01033.1 hypothetical protein B8W96_03775 [Lentilactobacillus parakefiri]
MGITQQSLAAYIGVSIRTVQSWEIGRTHPNPAARRLLQLLINNPALLNVFINESELISQK